MSEERRQPTPFLLRGDEPRRKATVKRPKKHERDTARRLGGMRHDGSGSQPGKKGDVSGVHGGEVVDFLVECKSTGAKSLRLELAWLNKITTEAGPMREPMLALRFDQALLKRMAIEANQRSGASVMAAEADWIAVPRSVMERLFAELGKECPDVDEA